MDLLRESLALAADGLRLPGLETEVAKLDQHGGGENAHEEHSHMPGCPPWRSVHNDGVLHKAGMLFEIVIVLPGGRLNTNVAPLGICV